MPSYMIRNLPEGLVARAKARARELQPNRQAGDVLDELLVGALERYAQGITPAETGAQGGRVRAAKLSAEQRSESARRAVTARWGRRRTSDDTSSSS